MKTILTGLFAFFVLMTTSYSEDMNEIISNATKAVAAKKTLGDECYIQNYKATMDFSTFMPKNPSPTDSIESDLPQEPMMMSIPIRIYHDSKDKFRLEVSVMGHRMILIRNGEKMYFSDDGERFSDDSVGEAPGGKKFLAMLNLMSVRKAVDLLNNNDYLKYSAGSDNIFGKECHKILMVSKDQDTLYIYLDKNTNLPVKATSVIQENSTQVALDFSYGEYENDRTYYINNSFRIMVIDGDTKSGKIDIPVTMSKIEFRDKFDDILFEPKVEKKEGGE
jgi:hypothetical protein